MNVGLIIAGEIDRKLQMIEVEIDGVSIAGDYSLPQTSRRIAYPESAGHDGTDPKRGIEVLGFGNAIKRFQLTPGWSNGNDELVAKRLITLETQDANDSLYVGLPISEIVIKRHGTRWISKGDCQ